jgi:hypothetical protein
VSGDIAKARAITEPDVAAYVEFAGCPGKAML